MKLIFLLNWANILFKYYKMYIRFLYFGNTVYKYIQLKSFYILSRLVYLWLNKYKNK